MRKVHKTSLFTVLLSATVLFLACNSTADNPANVEITGEGSAIEDFASFYNKFHQDSLFQVSRISWPLNGNFVQDSLGEAKDLRYELSEWVMHRPILDNPDFVQQIRPLTEDLIVEEIKARAGKYRIERRFARLTGGWHLIYYHVSGI